MERSRKKTMNMMYVTVGKGTFPFSKKIDPYSNSPDIIISIFRNESQGLAKTVSNHVSLFLVSKLYKTNYLIGKENMETKGKCNDKHSKDDETFKKGVEDIMEDSDVLSDNWHLPHVDQKIYPSQSKNHSIYLPNWTLITKGMIRKIEI